MALLGLATVLAVIVLHFRGRDPLRATVSLDPSGAEMLALECVRCADGTLVRIGGATGTFASHRTAVAIGNRLVVGENRLTLTLVYPDGRAEDVQLVVPVDFRLDPDLSALSASPPSVRVTVATTSGAAVVVNGVPVAIEPDGRGNANVDVTTELTGPSATVTTLEKTIPYVVTPAHAKPASGELLVKLGVASLLVEAPGDSIVVDGPNFWLAGRTLVGGTVTVGGRPIAVDDKGQFAQLMSVSAVGETTIFIRADAPDYAPRLVPLHVRRVADLRTEAARLDAIVTHSYAEIANRIATKKGFAVGVECTIVEARIDGHRTIIVADVHGGCPAAPCYARVVHGARATPARGETWRAYGRVDRAVEWPRPGVSIPEIRAEFLIPPVAP
ncbi:MAG: hypothetical protein JW751_30165 [Polyangiaceae bacterium]|nr:hypothetical protein [Polyangiaceae bacterium]